MGVVIRMVRCFNTIFMAAVVLLFVRTACSEDIGHATAHAHVVVSSNISVVALTPNVDLGTVQVGTFPGVIVFRVDANVEMVSLWCVGTSLYKGNDPRDPQVAPIVLYRDGGARLEPTSAAPIQGGSTVAPFLETVDFNGFTGWISDRIAFESSQPGYFSQDVILTLTWDQPDPEKPRGEYSGWVILWASVSQV